jgi:hypothetical protein
MYFFKADKRFIFIYKSDNWLVKSNHDSHLTVHMYEKSSL